MHTTQSCASFVSGHSELFAFPPSKPTILSKIIAFAMKRAILCHTVSDLLTSKTPESQNSRIPDLQAFRIPEFQIRKGL